MLALDEVYLHK